MGLAGPKFKQRFGTDPNNSNWTIQNSIGYKFLEKYDIKTMKTTPVRLKKKLNSDGIGHQLHKETSSYLSDLDALFTKNVPKKDKTGMTIQKLSVQEYFAQKKRGIV